MSLELPKLCDRTGDIPLLCAHFLGEGWDIEVQALKALEEYSWPGNIRQLSNAIERAKIMSDGLIIQMRDLPKEITQDATKDVGNFEIDTDNLSTIERAKVINVLRRVGGNKTRAAQMLGIDRRKLYRLVEKYDIAKAEINDAFSE